MRPGFALGARLADAVERREPLLGEPRHLAGEVRLALAPQDAPLAVADEDERDAGVLQHRGGHLARERALALAEDVLRGERDPAFRRARRRRGRGPGRTARRRCRPREAAEARRVRARAPRPPMACASSSSSRREARGSRALNAGLPRRAAPLRRRGRATHRRPSTRARSSRRGPPPSPPRRSRRLPRR